MNNFEDQFHRFSNPKEAGHIPALRDYSLERFSMTARFRSSLMTSASEEAKGRTKFVA